MRCHIDVETVVRERKGLCLQLARVRLSQAYVLTQVARGCVQVCMCSCAYFTVQILEPFPSLSACAWSLVSKERQLRRAKLIRVEIMRS